jgi:hypothetical protein
MTDFEKTALREHRFWLQILGDHSRFIQDSLAPQEQREWERARYFMETFDQLLERVDRENLIEISQKAEEESRKLREFKLHLIERHLLGRVRISLGPAFMNHMVNELEEYLRILDYLKQGVNPPIFHELHHHLLWLLDAAGHAGTISDNMDQTEKSIKKKSDDFTKEFEAFYLKAVEMTGFLRTNLSSFPALERFHQDVSLELKLFMSFLNELEELKLSKQALGTLAPLMADHMMREECYYLTKLAESTDLPRPDCDPAKPRLKE